MIIEDHSSERKDPLPAASDLLRQHAQTAANQSQSRLTESTSDYRVVGTVSELPPPYEASEPLLGRRPSAKGRAAKRFVHALLLTTAVWVVIVVLVLKQRRSLSSPVSPSSSAHD